MPPTDRFVSDRFVSPGGFGLLDPPRFVPGEFVTTTGTRPGACHRVLECLGLVMDYSNPSTGSSYRRWYRIEIGGVSVRICEGDLEPVEIVGELGRIVGG